MFGAFVDGVLVVAANSVVVDVGVAAAAIAGVAAIVVVDANVPAAVGVDSIAVGVALEIETNVVDSSLPPRGVSVVQLHAVPLPVAVASLLAVAVAMPPVVLRTVFAVLLPQPYGVAPLPSAAFLLLLLSFAVIPVLADV